MKGLLLACALALPIGCQHQASGPGCELLVSRADLPSWVATRQHAGDHLDYSHHQWQLQGPGRPRVVVGYSPAEDGAVSATLACALGHQ